MELVRSSLKVRIAAAALALGVLGAVAGYDAFRAAPAVIEGFELKSHRADHPEPPGCQKEHKYGKQPRDKCPNHP